MKRVINKVVSAASAASAFAVSAGLVAADGGYTSPYGGVVYHDTLPTGGTVDLMLVAGVALVVVGTGVVAYSKKLQNAIA